MKLHSMVLSLAKAALVVLALSAIPQAALADRFYPPRSTALDADANPLSGAKLYFYETGTSTPLDTYSDDGLTSANANPVVADSSGVFGEIFLKNEDYKVVLTTSADVTKWTADPVRSIAPTTRSITAKTTTYTVVAGDDGKLITADASGGAFTITLLDAATAGNGFEVAFIKIDSSTNIVTIDGDGTETINGALTYSLEATNQSVQLVSDGSNWYTLASSAPPPAGHKMTGFTLAKNATDASNDIDVGVGTVIDSSGSRIIDFATALTKRLDASFAEGTDAGCLDTGAEASSTRYYIWAIFRSDTNEEDILCSLSSSSPTMPSNYDFRGLIGSMVNDASSVIEQLTRRDGDAEDFRPMRFSPLDTTSGTDKDFIEIHDSITEVVVFFDGASLGSTASVLVQIGTGGTPTTSGYASSSSHITGSSPGSQSSTTGFTLRIEAASNLIHGFATLRLVDEDANGWVFSATLSRTVSNATTYAGGYLELGAGNSLDIVRLTPDSGSWDAGRIGGFAR